MSDEPDHQEPEMSDTTIDLTVLASLTDTMLYEAWASESLSEDAIPTLVREYELEARRRGFDVAMVAAVVDVGLTAVSFSEVLHPRGLDGTFIEKHGIVDVLNFKTKDVKGNPIMFNRDRGEVMAIEPDPKGGQPNIKVGFKNPKTGKMEHFITVKPDNIKSAPKAKAHLDQPDKLDAPGKNMSQLADEAGLIDGPNAKQAADLAKQSADESAKFDEHRQNVQIPLESKWKGRTGEKVNFLGDEVTITGEPENGSIAVAYDDGEADTVNLDEIKEIKAKAAPKKSMSQQADEAGFTDTPAASDRLTELQNSVPGYPEGSPSRNAVMDEIASIKSKREASGSTIQDGEVVGEDTGFQGSNVKLLDGTDSKIGTKVQYAKDGTLGEIVGYDKSDNYVKVKMDDGKTVTRSKRTLKAPPKNMSQQADDAGFVDTGGPISTSDRQKYLNAEARLKIIANKSFPTAEDLKARANAQRIIDDYKKRSAPGAAPSAPFDLTPAGVSEATDRLASALRDSDSQYAATDPTILDLIEKSLAASPPNAKTVMIAPPSEAEVNIPRDVGELLIKARKQAMLSAAIWTMFGPDDLPVTAANWSAPLHPRGRDGKFIEKFGLIELFDVKGANKGQRAHVTDITQDKKGKPEIEVRLLNPDGSAGKRMTVNPENVQQAPDKARLNAPDPSARSDDIPTPGTPFAPPVDPKTMSRKDRKAFEKQRLELQRNAMKEAGDRARSERALSTVAPLDLDSPPEYPSMPELQEEPDQPGWVKAVNGMLNHTYEGPGGFGYGKSRTNRRNIAKQVNLDRKSLDELRKSNMTAENQEALAQYQAELSRASVEDDLWTRAQAGDPLAEWQLARLRARREQARLTQSKPKESARGQRQHSTRSLVDAYREGRTGQSSGGGDNSVVPTVEEILDHWGISRTPPKTLTAPPLPPGVPPPPSGARLAPPVAV